MSAQLDPLVPTTFGGRVCQGPSLLGAEFVGGGGQVGPKDWGPSLLGVKLGRNFSGGPVCGGGGGSSWAEILGKSLQCRGFLQANLLAKEF